MVVGCLLKEFLAVTLGADKDMIQYQRKSIEVLKD
jgi:hypothetical protein